MSKLDARVRLIVRLTGSGPKQANLLGLEHTILVMAANGIRIAPPFLLGTINRGVRRWNERLRGRENTFLRRFIACRRRAHSRFVEFLATQVDPWRALWKRQRRGEARLLRLLEMSGLAFSISTPCASGRRSEWRFPSNTSQESPMVTVYLHLSLSVSVASLC